MIYKGLNRIGMIGDIKTNGGGEIAEVYGGIGESNPIYYKQREMVGTSPMQFKALGLPLKDYRIYGETLQDGTPSPDMPVDVVGCGVRTENLFDDVILQNNKGLDFSGSVTDFDGRVATGKPIDVSNISTVTLKYTGTGINFIYATFKSGILVERVAGKLTGDVIRTSNCDELYICFYSVSAITKDDVSNIMLNLGSIALPYEPYGYKLPVTTTNGTDTVTTPIYIGSEPLHRIGEYADYVDYSSGKIMRRIKKIIIHNDGALEFGRARLNTPDIARIDIVIEKYGKAIYFPTVSVSDTIPRTCSHLMRGAFSSNNGEVIGSYSNYSFVPTLFLSTIDATGEADTSIVREKIIEWFDEQYSKGTPVTVWYVLETPIEEDPPVPFPEISTLSGTNTMSVDTAVKPSAISITGNIKPTGYGQLLDVNDVDIQDSNGTPIFIHG